MRKREIKRWLIYSVAMVVLAFGVTLNTKAGLGVSPFVSVTYAISEIWNLNFGDVTFISYVLFVGVEMLLHSYQWKQQELTTYEWKERLLFDVLQLPVSLLFTRLLNVYTDILPHAVEDLGLGWGGRIVLVVLGILITGIGAAATLSMRLVPNPADGIVQTTADTLHTPLGLTKNGFDIVNVTLTLTIGLLTVGEIRGIGIGTILAVVGIGRVIAWYQKQLLPRVNRMLEDSF